MTSDSKFVSAVEAAKRLGVSRGMIYAHAKQGSIPHIRLGDRVLVSKVWLEQQEKKASG